jgi:hypothetical protein
LKFKTLTVVAALAAISLTTLAEAAGGFSSGSRPSMARSPSYSKPAVPAPSVAQSRPNVAPAAPQRFSQPAAPANVAPGAPQRFSQPQQVTRPAQQTAQAPAAPRTTTTTTSTTTTNRTHSSRVNTGGGVMYGGGFGMGYPYMGMNGLLTGMIIGSMMHPHHTTVYAGPGPQSGNALLYPDGRVVNNQGYHVGNYQNGQYAPVENGAMVAQQVPQDAYTSQPQQVAQPVITPKQGPSFGEVFLSVLLGFSIIGMLVYLFRKN